MLVITPIMLKPMKTRSKGKFNWAGRRVLVTGAGGFIGSHLVEELVRRGARVRAFVHYNAMGRWGWLEESNERNAIDGILGDIRDRDSVASAMKDQDVVFHLAAMISIPHSYTAPLSFIDTNIIGTTNILLEARRAGVSRVIHTSTSETYGTAQYIPIDEHHPLQGQSPYSATKIGADALVESFVCSYNVPVVTIRPFNTYGPRQSARAVIPTIITQLIAGRGVSLGSLEPTRDLNYVTDTVEGFLAGAAAIPSVIGEVINIGSRKEISIGELAQRIATMMDKPLRIRIESQRLRPKPSEVFRLCADTKKARHLLNWKSTVSLKEGLKRTIEWFQDPRHQASYNSNRYLR